MCQVKSTTEQNSWRYVIRRHRSDKSSPQRNLKAYQSTQGREWRTQHLWGAVLSSLIPSYCERIIRCTSLSSGEKKANFQLKRTLSLWRERKRFDNWIMMTWWWYFCISFYSLFSYCWTWRKGTIMNFTVKVCVSESAKYFCRKHSNCHHHILIPSFWCECDMVTSNGSSHSREREIGKHHVDVKMW